MRDQPCDPNDDPWCKMKKGGMKKTDKLAKLTKEELIKQAQKKKIDGRSTMKKGELVVALSKKK